LEVTLFQKPLVFGNPGVARLDPEKVPNPEDESSIVFGKM
jgi:hypothetical protein